MGYFFYFYYYPYAFYPLGFEFYKVSYLYILHFYSGGFNIWKFWRGIVNGPGHQRPNRPHGGTYPPGEGGGGGVPPM